MCKWFDVKKIDVKSRNVQDNMWIILEKINTCKNRKGPKNLLVAIIWSRLSIFNFIKI